MVKFSIEDCWCKWIKCLLIASQTTQLRIQFPSQIVGWEVKGWWCSCGCHSTMCRSTSLPNHANKQNAHWRNNSESEVIFLRSNCHSNQLNQYFLNILLDTQLLLDNKSIYSVWQTTDFTENEQFVNRMCTFPISLLF